MFNHINDIPVKTITESSTGSGIWRVPRSKAQVEWQKLFFFTSIPVAMIRTQMITATRRTNKTLHIISRR